MHAPSIWAYHASVKLKIFNSKHTLKLNQTCKRVIRRNSNSKTYRKGKRVFQNDIRRGRFTWMSEGSWKISSGVAKEGPLLSLQQAPQPSMQRHSSSFLSPPKPTWLWLWFCFVFAVWRRRPAMPTTPRECIGTARDMVDNTA